MGPIANLADVDGDVGVLWGGCDGELDSRLSVSIMVEGTNDLTGCHCQRETSGT
jgi:hypothetical protein